MTLNRLAKRRARQTFPSAQSNPEQAAFTLGFMAGHDRAVESILWGLVLIAWAIAICVWLFKF